MMREYVNPVNPPKNHPFCFAFPPAIKPPVNNEIKVIAVMMYCTDDSCKDVNLNINAKMKLLIIAKINMVIVPYNTALPIFFDPSISILSPLIFVHVFVHAYS